MASEMTARENLRQCLIERRAFPRDSYEYAYLTRAARKYAWLARGVPTNQWEKRK
jgi:hypothetical protein